MRARLVRRFVVVAMVAVVLLGVPLATIGSAYVRADAVRAVDREADAIGFAAQRYLDDGRPIPAAEVAAFVAGGRYVVIRDADGVTSTFGELGDDGVHAQIRLDDGATVDVWAPDGERDRRQLQVVMLIAGLAVVAVAVAALLGGLLARRLARPLDDLADASRRLGDGDFTARAPRSGIVEIDDVATAMDASAERIATMIVAERQFSANASHQLRTPLTALRLRLEEIHELGDTSVRAEAELALRQADRLTEIIGELIALARPDARRHRQPIDLAVLLREHLPLWHQHCADAGRRLVVQLPDHCEALASTGGTVQVVQTLIENALRHGRGTVSLQTHRLGDAVLVTVSDEGHDLSDADTSRLFQRDVSTAGGTGVGLALARALAEADGGRLELVDTRPTRFRLTAVGPMPASIIESAADESVRNAVVEIDARMTRPST